MEQTRHITAPLPQDSAKREFNMTQYDPRITAGAG